MCSGNVLPYRFQDHLLLERRLLGFLVLVLLGRHAPLRHLALVAVGALHLAAAGEDVVADQQGSKKTLETPTHTHERKSKQTVPR
jgi:hypothetical protein